MVEVLGDEGVCAVLQFLSEDYVRLGLLGEVRHLREPMVQVVLGDLLVYYFLVVLDFVVELEVFIL